MALLLTDLPTEMIDLIVSFLQPWELWPVTCVCTVLRACIERRSWQHNKSGLTRQTLLTPFLKTRTGIEFGLDTPLQSRWGVDIARQIAIHGDLRDLMWAVDHSRIELDYCSHAIRNWVHSAVISAITRGCDITVVSWCIEHGYNGCNDRSNPPTNRNDWLECISTAIACDNWDAYRRIITALQPAQHASHARPGFCELDVWRVLAAVGRDQHMAYALWRIPHTSECLEPFLRGIVDRGYIDGLDWARRAGRMLPPVASVRAAETGNIAVWNG